jgi:hypothetical protein
MEALSKYFDHYVISARIKPAFFAVLPLAATLAVWWPNAQQLGGAVLTFLVTFGAVGFFSNLISNHGNVLQARLFAEWGGAPTTALLRFADATIDSYTKARYHRRLEAIVPGLKLPTEAEERSDGSRADACYTSAVNFLREHTRDKSKYPMVYADNVAYGYARNLLVMKPWGISAAVIGVVVNAMLLSSILARWDAGAVSFQDADALFRLGAGGLSIAMLWLFVGVVDREYVKGRAERYAKSLLAVCERVSE